jgi:hypothetical protein
VAQLDGHGAVPLDHRLGRRHRVGQERLEIGIGARAVHQEPDVQVRGGLGDHLGRIRVREIDCHRARSDTGPGLDTRSNLVEHRLATGQQHDVHAAIGKSFGEGRTHAVRGACDDCPRSVVLGEAHEPSPTVVTRTGVKQRRAMRQPASVLTMSSS